MRVPRVPAAVAALTLTAALAAPSASRAQDPATPEITPPPVASERTIPMPGTSAWVNVGPVVPELVPTPYAPAMLPPSTSHPWVILADPSRFGGYVATDSYRTSPYGDYSRYSYHRTGPFAALPRPAVWYSEPDLHRLDHSQQYHVPNPRHRHPNCTTCP